LILEIYLTCTQSIFDISTTSHPDFPQFANGKLKKIVQNSTFAPETLMSKKEKFASKDVSLNKISPIFGFDDIGQKL
jgi:hypothetical protein